MPAINQRILLQAIALRQLRKRLKRKGRECSIRPIFANRKTQGERTLVEELRDDPYYHHRYFRMNAENFDEILALVEDDLKGASTHSHPISPTEKLAIALRYLATGSSQVQLAFSYRISPSSISMILRAVLESIIKRLGPEYLPIPTEETWKKNEEGFRSIWNFPNAIGAVDGKHIRINCPAHSGSLNYNYKQFYSIVLMAIAGPDYKFTAVDIGASGSQSDGGVFSRSLIGEKMEKGNLGIPPPKNVGNELLPHVILGDDAFQLKEQLMKPYPGKFLELDRRIFNYRLSRARMVVENSFGILSARWRIFGTTILADSELVKSIVHASIILHNYLISKNDFSLITPDSEVNGVVVPGNWRASTAKDNGMENLSQQGSNNFKISANCVRNSFKDYFNSDNGSVSWQNDMVDR